MSEIRYTRCDHGQWLQDGPCGACNAARQHHGFALTDYQVQRFADMVADVDALHSLATEAGRAINRMVRATDHETFSECADAYATVVRSIQNLTSNL